MRPFAALLLLTLLSAAAPSRALAMGVISTDGFCDGTGKVTFHWHYDEPGGPADAPQWIGYDVYRRNATGCGDWVRVNADPYPRVAAPHDYTYEETPADPSVVWEYQVRFVDASRQETYFVPCDCSARAAWTSCPPASPAITKGRLVNIMGWTPSIVPCVGSCLPEAYIGNVPLPDGLAQYVGTNQVIEFFGGLGCGSLEGCGITIDHWQLAPACDIVPTTRTSWGRVKVVYR